MNAVKLTIEATDRIVQLDGQLCRVWVGMTEAGNECRVIVRAVRPKTQEGLDELRAGLTKVPWSDDEVRISGRAD